MQELKRSTGEGLPPHFIRRPLVFSLWDIVAIARDHWTYNPKYVTGIHLGDLPLEEVVFFIVIPICALLSYEAVGTVLEFFAKKTTSSNGRSPRWMPVTYFGL